MSYCLILFSTVILGCQVNTALSSPAMGACRMEAHKIDLSIAKRDDFIEACMQSRGFRRSYREGCFQAQLNSACYIIDN